MAVPQSVRKSATSGKPEDRRAFPPDPWDQGRSVRTGTAEDALPFTSSSVWIFRVGVIQNDGDVTLLWDCCSTRAITALRHNTLQGKRLDTHASLRDSMRSARLKLSASQRIAAADALVASLEQLPEFLVDSRVAGYWAVTGELPLHAAYTRLRARDQAYHLPIISAGNHLAFAAWQPGRPLKNNRFGIPEPDVLVSDRMAPSELELVLVPLLGFDRKGHRLGSGGGFYDRSFSFLQSAARPAQPLMVGIGYHFQEVDSLAPRPWDVALDFIATDRELISCSGIELS